MEIKRTPTNANPIEVARPRTRKKWPWIVGGVSILVIVVVGIIVYMLLRNDSAEPEVATPTPTETNTVVPPTEGEQPFSVAKAPVASDLTSVVYGRYESPLESKGSEEQEDFTGPLTVFGADASEPGVLKEKRLFEFKRQEGDTPVRGGVVSPNGQFVVLQENPGATPDTAAYHLSIIELATGKEITLPAITGDLYGLPVWLPDSSGFVYSTFVLAQDKGTSVLFVYDVERNEIDSYQRDEESADRNALIPLKITKDELIAIRTIAQSEAVGEIGSIKIGERGILNGAFKKIIDPSPAINGFDISKDGQRIIMARGSGDDLGSLDTAPYVLELFDRETGKLEELRSSPTERYTSPRFTSDGEGIVYGAVSGLWFLELESGDRRQLFSTETVESLSSDAIVRPLSVNPSGDIFLFTITSPSRKNTQFYTLPVDAEDADAEELGDLRSENDLEENFLGWTE
jgi:hypothetical protein